jgi:ADP-ribose pyrophosphatase YjhB (NUDIX family)
MVELSRERLPVSVSAAVFIEDEQGRLLLLQQSSEEKGKKWSPPSGGMFPHEDPFENAIREAREEIGVEIEFIDLIGIYTIDRGDKNTSMGFVFRAKIMDGEIKLAEGEIDNYKFFTPDEIEELIDQDLLYKPEYNRQCVEDWINGLSFPLGVVRPLTNNT